MEPSKQPKQVIQLEHNIVKSSNLLEVNQLAICKRGRGFELGATLKQIQVVVRVGLKPGKAGLREQRADYSAALSPWVTSQTELKRFGFLPFSIPSL